MVCGFLFSFCNLNSAACAADFSDLTIIVTSCDKYSNLWNPFFELLFKNWQGLRESKMDILLISNKKQYPDNRITPVMIANEKSWSDNMLQALKKVKTKYVMILLEDYFITKFDEKRLAEVFAFMKSYNAAYVQIACEGLARGRRGKDEVSKGIATREKHEPWRTSLQACLWRVSELQFLLKDTESPWDFEKAASLRSEGCMTPFLVVFEDSPLDYLNMTQLGYLNVTNLETAKKMGVSVDTQGMKLDTDIMGWFRCKFKPYVYWNFYKPFMDFFKNDR